MKQCPTCGSNVSEGASVCTDCGMELTDSASLAPIPNLPIPSSVIPPAVPVHEILPLLEQTSGLAVLTLKRNGVLTSHAFQLGETVLVGRFDPASGPVDVDLGSLPEATYISRHHAELRRDSTGQWFIKDLDASNGTFSRTVGENQFKRVTGEQPIQDGDEIALGNARFQFRVS